MKLAPLFLAAAAASTLFVTGCGRPAFLVFDRNSAYQEALGFTREGEVRNYFETKALVTATYMNPLDGERFKDGEFFFVGRSEQSLLPADPERGDSPGLLRGGGRGPDAQDHAPGQPVEPVLRGPVPGNGGGSPDPHPGPRIYSVGFVAVFKRAVKVTGTPKSRR